MNMGWQALQLLMWNPFRVTLYISLNMSRFSSDEAKELLGNARFKQLQSYFHIKVTLARRNFFIK